MSLATSVRYGSSIAGRSLSMNAIMKTAGILRCRSAAASLRSFLIACLVVGIAFGAMWIWKRSHLISRLQSPDAEIRYHALQDLNVAVRCKTISNLKPYLSVLREAIDTETSADALTEVIAILQHISAEDGEEFVPAILRRLIEKNDPLSIQLGLVSALGGLGATENHRVVSTLCDLLRSETAFAVKREAALALGNLAGTSTRPIEAALREGLEDSNALVSVACAVALWSKNKSDESIQRLLVLLDHHDNRVRRDAAGAFAQLEIKSTKDGEALKGCILKALEARLQVEGDNVVRFWIEEAIRVISS